MKSRKLLRWWLILCVNLAGPQSAQLFGQTLLWVCVWGCFGMRLTFEFLDWIKQIALPVVGGPHSISWRSNRTKRLALWVRKFSSAWLPSSWTLVFSCLQTWTEIGALPGPLAYRLWAGNTSPAKVSDLWTWTETQSSALLGLQFANCRFEDSVSIVTRVSL